jgi:hypothetical protein
VRRRRREVEVAHAKGHSTCKSAQQARLLTWTWSMSFSMISSVGCNDNEVKKMFQSLLYSHLQKSPQTQTHL